MSDKAYIQMLIESQEKKLSLLEETLELDRKQLELIRSEDPDLEAIDINLNRKGMIVTELDKLDDGFESVYAKVRDELTENKEAHKDEIKKLQELISKITDLLVKIQAEELRGNEEVDKFLKNRRSRLKGNKSSVKAANTYAINMRKVNKIDSFFVDKKK